MTTLTIITNITTITTKGNSSKTNNIYNTKNNTNKQINNNFKYDNNTRQKHVRSQGCQKYKYEHKYMSLYFTATIITINTIKQS